MFQPTTNVRVLRNVDCDFSQQNVLSFNSLSEQTNYYISKTKHNFPTCRVEGATQNFGSIVLPGTPSDFYDCNYIMWCNTQFTGKWFYAYLNNVRPLNSGACIADYVIDHFRTWYFEWSLGPCLVAREHVNSDARGEWLLPENIEAGEYQLAPSAGNEIDLLERAGVDISPKLVIVYTYSPAEGDDGDFFVDVSNGLTYRFAGCKPVFAGGYVESGIFQGSRYLAFNCTDEDSITRINTYISYLVGQGQINKIQDMFMCPGWLCSHALAIPVSTFNPVSVTATGNASPSVFGTYIPHNAKLFNQQFNYLVLSNNMGSVIELGYEYFQGAPQFTIFGSLAQNSQMMLYPKNYKNSDGDNHQYGVELSGFPHSSFSYSQFNQDFNANSWSNRVSQVQDIFGGIMDVAGSATSMGLNQLGAQAPKATASDQYRASVIGPLGIVNSAGNAALSVANQIAEYHDKRRVPNTLAGSADGNIVFSMGRMTYSLYQMQISEPFARKVDAYLDMYGYRVDTYKTPNLSGRPNWNYVQCVDPVVKGNLPVEAKESIYNIFSRGVRIWHNPSTWMNYTADNKL